MTQNGQVCPSAADVACKDGQSIVKECGEQISVG